MKVDEEYSALNLNRFNDFALKVFLFTKDELKRKLLELLSIYDDVIIVYLIVTS